MVMLTAVVSSLLVTTGCIRIVPGGEGVTGSSTLVTKEFDFTGFTDIEVGNAFEVDVTRSDTYSVKITLNENLFDYLDVSLSGRTLQIRMKSHYTFFRATRQASITLPDLRALDVSGASRGEVTGFDTAGTMYLEVSEASNLALTDLTAGEVRLGVSGASRTTGSIDAGDAYFEISGASTVELEGSATDAELEISGASTARLERFPMETARVDASGASNATVEVSDRLNIEVSGASRLVYSGDAVLGSVHVSGGSTLSRR